jgi:hypothetical protein
MAIQQPPALTQSDPRAYYLWLQTQGLSPLQAVQEVQNRFGAPKSPEQQQKDLANQQQQEALAQTGGLVGGTLLATKGVPWLAGQLGLGVGTGTGTVATPTLVGAKIVGTGSTAAGTAGAGTAATGSTLGTVGSVAWPVALAVGTISNAWESGMKDILRGRGDRSDWINQGVNVATGFLPNTALRLMGKRSIGKMMTTGKSDAQLLRDDFRGLLKQTGVADDSYNVTLADGSQFNIGLDGKTKYKNVGENIDGKKTRNAWDVDFSNPLAQFAVDKIDPMIRNIYQDTDGKLKPEQYTGMLVNAVTSNAKSQDDILANINAMLGKSTFAKEAGVELPQMPKGRQVSPPVKTPQVSTPEGKEKSKSIRDALQQFLKKD